MISTNDVRPGMALDLDDGLFSIVEYQHVKPGKGRAFVKMKLKKLETGQVMERTFRADEDVTQAIIDRSEHQYLYSDDLGYHFMNLSDYGQIVLNSDDIGDAAGYLVDGMTVILPMHQGTPIGVEMPAAVELEVTYAEPGVKGDTRTGATKGVRVETGIDVQVPLFVEQGDRIKVDTRTGEYLTKGMTDPAAAMIIPARITVDDLAVVIGRDAPEVQAVLRARGEPDAPEDVLGAELAIVVASVLGVPVTVEPRDLALERLYEFETRGEMGSDVGGRAGAMVEGVVSSLDELDEMIESVAEHWSVARMPVIDRNIIRIGLYELRSDPSTPTPVVISEAVRLAQTYSTERSSAFVNGVLATLARTVRDS